jgi:hypothetical protein
MKKDKPKFTGGFSDKLIDSQESKTIDDTGTNSHSNKREREKYDLTTTDGLNSSGKKPRIDDNGTDNISGSNKFTQIPNQIGGMSYNSPSISQSNIYIFKFITIFSSSSITIFKYSDFYI